MNSTPANPNIPSPARIVSVRPETATDVTYRVEWPREPAPGQFFEVSVPGLGEAPISVSDFGPGFVDMTIRKVGRVTDGIFALKAGDALLMRGPYGHGFPVDRFRERHLVIAAGGTGLAPVKSVIGRFVGRPEDTLRLDVLLGFKSPSDILFRDEIAHWSREAHVLVTVDRAADGWDGHVGVVTTLLRALELPDTDAVEAVVVGPPMMMRFSVIELLRRGIPEDRIWISYERRMSCGLGKCGHCKIGDRYVCLDGPVFNYNEARWLTD